MKRSVACAATAALLWACAPGAADRDGGSGGRGDGGGAAIDAAPGDCRPGETSCGGACVVIATDRNHCGRCDHPCADTEVCENGTCTEDTCAETSSTAESVTLPADILVVVDNSGSMTDEAGFVQDAMNSFVNVLTASGIDAHVILISADSTDEQGICVPAPLGSGSCPNDEKLPTYRHVVTEVGSRNSLQLILSTYDQWKDSLRPDATRTIAVISDDNSALAASDFATMIVALDPSFEGFKFDAIVAPYDLSGVACFPCQINMTACNTCDPCCGTDSTLGIACVPLPASEGTVYKQLVSSTGGVLGNLCTQDFLPAFMDMATAVVDASQVACVYNIPDPPGGEMIDYTRVNVGFAPNPGGPEEVIPNVPGGLADCGPSGGWYYDDPTAPTQILLCPATCDRVQMSADGSITVKFGCSTIVN